MSLDLIQKAIDTMSVWADKINLGFQKTDSNEARIDALEPASTDHEARIAANEAEIWDDPVTPAQPSIIDQNTSAIANNAANIADNAADIVEITEVGIWDDVKADYKRGNIVRAGEWSCMAKIDDPPAGQFPGPVPNGAPINSTADFAPEDPDPGEVGTVVVSGHRMTFTVAGWLRNIRVWAPKLTTGTNYRLALVDITDPNVPRKLENQNPLLVEGEWATVSELNVPVTAGTVLEIYIDAFDVGSLDGFSTGYTIASRAVAPDVSPTSGNMSIDDNDPFIYVNEVDLDGIARTAQFTGLPIGATIRLVNAGDADDYEIWTVQAVVGAPVSGVFTINAVRTEFAGSLPQGTTVSLAASQEVGASTEYARHATYWTTFGQPSYATVEGFLKFDGVDQPGEADSAFGLDLIYQPASLNDDWGLIGQYGILGADVGSQNPLPSQVSDAANFTTALQDQGITATNISEQPEFKSADFTHTERKAYLCDVAGGDFTIRVYDETDDSFAVYDSTGSFGTPVNGVFIEIMNPDGITVKSTFKLNGANHSYSVFKVDGDWFWNEIGTGVINGPF